MERLSAAFWIRRLRFCSLCYWLLGYTWGIHINCPHIHIVPDSKAALLRIACVQLLPALEIPPPRRASGFVLELLRSLKAVSLSIHKYLSCDSFQVSTSTSDSRLTRFQVPLRDSVQEASLRMSKASQEDPSAFWNTVIALLSSEICLWWSCFLPLHSPPIRGGVVALST